MFGRFSGPKFSFWRSYRRNAKKEMPKDVRNCFYSFKKAFIRKILVLLYRRKVQPILQYGAIVHGTANKSELKKPIVHKNI